jgi:hypothetical protein
MINALKEGKNVQNDAVSGKMPVELICAIYQAAKTGKDVFISGGKS